MMPPIHRTRCDERSIMLAAIVLLVLIAILFGIGLAVTKVLLWIAAILFAVWLIGWFVGAGTTTGARRRWYAW
jgi:uncharacterized membrane protein